MTLLPGKTAFHVEMARLLFVGDPDKLTRDTPMSREAGTLDSMGETEIVYLVEDMLETHLPFSEFEKIKTYGEFLDLIVGRGARL